MAVLHGCPDTRRVAMTGHDAARAIGVRLLCVNRPGYGRSTTHASTHGTVADDLAEVAEMAPEFLAWRASVDPADPDDDALTARWLSMLPPAETALVAALGPAAVAASVREALDTPDGYLRDAALLHRPWQHGPAEVRCSVRAWFGEDDDRSEAGAAANLLEGFADIEVVVRPRT